jgi:transcriptional regulator with XRE-family HTH domain
VKVSQQSAFEVEMEQLFIREWRRFRAISQADLAQRAGVTEATISRLEQPGPPAARPSTIRKLAAALEIAPHALYAPPSSMQHEEPQ